MKNLIRSATRVTTRCGTPVVLEDSGEPEQQSTTTMNGNVGVRRLPQNAFHSRVSQSTNLRILRLCAAYTYYGNGNVSLWTNDLDERPGLLQRVLRSILSSIRIQVFDNGKMIVAVHLCQHYQVSFTPVPTIFVPIYLDEAQSPCKSSLFFHPRYFLRDLKSAPCMLASLADTTF